MKLFPRILANMKHNNELQQMYIDESSYDQPYLHQVSGNNAAAAAAQ